ncbi:bifunctional 5,10-methylenetetrahydrofolate dehydrogenase/5,10-methenyltetrahydrofolate cyclohydrolase [candidate division WWE3 bacterium]|uniref:Bifunctional protein FolD n=1 Tax=candidate division WWE3 bacterium TaxID=2053526 RepID=A0A955LLD7_UNCKA|nr:bifunctional 5,10-methylenetetrahydrofolate dehydrogenase/5,10-methenyltetrahydrofolate cyclohydrolase [candidate division WWE3 bacterium]
MAAQLIDGKERSITLLEQMRDEVSSLEQKPGLASIVVGNDPNSHLYVDIKKRTAEEIGLHFQKFSYPTNFEASLVAQQIQELNADAGIHGILIQLPLPPQYNRSDILKQVHPFKDVDVLHPKNLGLLMEGSPRFLSPVVRAVNDAIMLTGKYPVTRFDTQKEEIEIADLTGVNVTLVGSGLLVGRPLAQFLSLIKATVTIVNEETQNLTQHTKSADIIVTGTNSSDVLQPEDVTDGSILIDVGYDIIADKFMDKDIFLSKNPGGIGPLTVAYLLKNTITASKNV